MSDPLPTPPPRKRTRKPKAEAPPAAVIPQETENLWTMSALRTLAEQAGVQFDRMMGDKSPAFLRWVIANHPAAMPVLRARFRNLDAMIESL